jgi:ribosome-binding protein aMBF1 (putative translation factor)
MPAPSDAPAAVILGSRADPVLEAEPDAVDSAGDDFDQRADVIMPTGAHVKAWRAGQGLTQRDLAQAVGTVQGVISRIESGRTQDRKALVAIAEMMAAEVSE